MLLWIFWNWKLHILNMRGIFINIILGVTLLKKLRFPSTKQQKPKTEPYFCNFAIQVDDIHSFLNTKNSEEHSIKLSKLKTKIRYSFRTFNTIKIKIGPNIKTFVIESKIYHRKKIWYNIQQNRLISNKYNVRTTHNILSIITNSYNT